MYSTILFDIDGVLLSEDQYFDATGLTVHELLTSPRWLGLSISDLPSYTPTPAEATVKNIRSIVFHADRVLYVMKSAGVNSNWDMAYLQFLYVMGCQLEKAKDTPEVWERMVPILSQRWSRETVPDIGRMLAGVSTPLTAEEFAGYIAEFHSCTTREEMFAHIHAWFDERIGIRPSEMDFGTIHQLAVDLFQEWYLGDESVQGRVLTGKRGFVEHEIPLAPPEQITKLFEEFYESGIQLGIGTGRVRVEMEVPFRIYGWRRFFTEDHVTTASEVQSAEARYPDVTPLSKPNPFSYLRSWLGANRENEAARPTLPIPKEEASRLLVVGDSVADWQAARAIGCHFAAVLTGLTGQAARPRFENLGCQYILDTVLELSRVFD